MGGLCENEKRNMISEKINQIYFNYPKIAEQKGTKEDFMYAIEQSLEDNEKKYLEDNTIANYYQSKIDNIWNKIKIDRAKESEKYKDIYRKLLTDHKKEMNKLKASIKEENMKKEQVYKKKFECMLQEIDLLKDEMEKKANEERQKIKNYKDYLDKQFKEKMLELQKNLKI